MNPSVRCGWCGTVKDFLAAPREGWLEGLSGHHRERMLEPPAESQVRAWESSRTLLKESLESLANECPFISRLGLVFEYELPRERGRRPDAVILSARQAVILEFKESALSTRAYIDQAAAYARDLRHYHAASRDLQVKPVLVLVQGKLPVTEKDGVDIVPGNLLAEYLRDLLADSGGPDLESWLESEYQPLPDIVSASRLLFEREPLPDIRRAQSAGIPQTVDVLSGIVEQARSSRRYHLAILTGVPGSGKTLAGLQLVYGNGNAGVRNEAVFLSGNGPLVDVLQHALKNKVFVQDVHGFLKHYGGSGAQVPLERVWVYDEAQRAWDANKSNEKRGTRVSQPEDFLRIAERIEDWTVIIALVGEGQEIHVGEEGGLAQWNDAMRKVRRRWTVHCPARFEETFSEAVDVVIHPELDLNVSLRSHLAEDVDRWVACLLDGDLKRAEALSHRIKGQGFDMYYTRDLEKAKDYVRSRYAGTTGKKYGLIASSKAVDLEYYGIPNNYFATRKVKYGPWYNSGPADRHSCCAMDEVVTEFGCQGLELDFPIVCWGSDMKWDGDGWRTPITRRINARDPRVLRLNSYRVLLTRGRDGFLVFVPPARRYDVSAAALKSAGMEGLDGDCTVAGPSRQSSPMSPVRIFGKSGLSGGHSLYRTTSWTGRRGLR